MALLTKLANLRLEARILSTVKSYESLIKYLGTPISSSSLHKFESSFPSTIRCLHVQRHHKWQSSPGLHKSFTKHISRCGLTGFGTLRLGHICQSKSNIAYFIHLFHTHRPLTAKLGSNARSTSDKNTNSLIYMIAVFILMLGGAYAGVPLYKVFCQATGLGGQAVQEKNTEKIENMKRVERPIKVRFNADVASSMRWNFKPQQTEVTVLPGETALAFYTAKNPTDKPIIGISTYNVLPYDAGQYFNKIQCFCFEEQRLNPKEQVDMPVFFYIDPEFAEDPKLENTEIITLSYTFFEAVEGLSLPLPGYPQPHDPLPSTT